MFKRPMLLGAALAVLLSTPASAAGTLAELAPCYVSAGGEQRQLVPIAAGGFTPDAMLDINVDDTTQATVKVGYNGTAIGSVKAPEIDSGQRPFTVRVAEQGKPETTITKSSLVTAFSVQQVPRVAKTDRKVRFRGRGFTQMADPAHFKYVFAHYVYAGRARTTVQIAYPEAPCGTFNVKRRQFPIKRPATGPWTIQFDQEPIYNPMALAQVRMEIKVKRAPKGSRAR
jgi:hypothetical protein